MDYPISVRHLKPDPDTPFRASRFKFHPYFASILNWQVTGTGDSREEALLDLRADFAARKALSAEKFKPPPRPGTKVPIEFASQERVDAQPDLAEDFTRRVLGLEWAFITDESSLWDFHTEETNEALLAKIKDVYGVTVDDIESGRLCEIFDRIAETWKLPAGH